MTRASTARLEPVQVGTPPPGQISSDRVIAPVHFNGFEGLTTVKDDPVLSPKFSCCGHKWKLEIYPGGDNDSTDGYAALVLENNTEEAIEVEYKFIIKHPNGGEDISSGLGKFVKFSPHGAGVVGDTAPAHAYSDFALRSALMDYLVDGTLIVEVHMRKNEPGQPTAPFVPENPSFQNTLNDFGNEETADVEFEVGGSKKSAADSRKRAKPSTDTFHAHYYILRLNAPALADMCTPGDDSSPTTIDNVQPEVFKHLLFYCYGGKINKEDLQKNAKDIIEAADRFGIVHLKLEAEACYVNAVDLALDNIIEVVTYAD